MLVFFYIKHLIVNYFTTNVWKTITIFQAIGGRVVSASGSETSVSSSTPTSAIIYDAYTSIIKKKKKGFSGSHAFA